MIGVAGCVAGGKLFRWDANQPVPLRQRLWAVPAVAAWAAVGVAAVATSHVRPPPRRVATTSGSAVHPWDAVTDAQVASIPVDNVGSDDGNIAPLAPPDYHSPVSEEQDRLDKFRLDLNAWPPAHAGDDLTRVQAILSVAAIADASRDPMEGPIARVAFDRLRGEFADHDLEQLLAYLILHQEAGTVLTTAPELDLPGLVAESTVRERVTMYAQKLLGRLTGQATGAADLSGSPAGDSRSMRFGVRTGSTRTSKLVQATTTAWRHAGSSTGSECRSTKPAVGGSSPPQRSGSASVAPVRTGSSTAEQPAFNRSGAGSSPARCTCAVQ